MRESKKGLGKTAGGAARLPAAWSELDRPWHSMPAEEVLAALRATRDGLSTAEVRYRQARFGRNVVPEAPQKRLIAVYLSQFKNAFIYLLLIAAAVSLFLGEMGDALFIAVALQINAIIGTFQEWQAQSRMQALKKMVLAPAIVYRASKWERIDGRDLVIGDIVAFEPGMQVPAAIRILTGDALEVNESLLTGESVPVVKDIEPELQIHTPLADRTNMLHAGTTILRGRGTGVVTATGARTEVGQVAQSLRLTEEVPPPLVGRMERFTHVVASLMVGVIFLIVMVELARGAPPAVIFLTAVALAVAAIPEGLPVAMTVALAISVTRMARHNVVVRKLAAVEGLGACTLIAADKTGTLTRNELTVQIAYLPGIGDIPVGTGEDGSADIFPARASLSAQAQKILERFIVTGSLCNESRLQEKEDGSIEIIGDTVDGALLLLARRAGIDPAGVEADFPRVARIPYDPGLSFAASFHEKNGILSAFVKGAAEVVLPMCEGTDHNETIQAMERLAQAGYRVLALAAGPVTGTGQEDLEGLELLGLAALMDPLRPRAADAVRRCRQAEIGRAHV